MPRRVRWATFLAFCLHGVLILTARYRLSYDAYTHMFFADHYRMHWWALWDPRWYAGFDVVSYPPLVHQVIGLISRIIGVDAAFALVLWVVAAAYPSAIYLFSRIFVRQAPSEYAALVAAFLPSIYLAAYTFGQLPTLAGGLLALYCAGVLAEFLRTGRRLSAALGVMLVATILAAHHASLLFLPGLFSAVGLHLLLSRQVSWRELVARFICFALFAGLAGLLVIWPFWRWGMTQSMQTPIDHATRHNFLIDLGAAGLFFWAVYGPLALVLPYAFRRTFNYRFFGLAIAFWIFFVLGLGGTTPLPRLLFGAGWEWLTYDRFAFWATLLLLPFTGDLVSIGKQKLQPFFDLFFQFLFGFPKPVGAGINKLLHSLRMHPTPLLAVLPLMAGTSMLVSLFPDFLPTQPRPLDMQPIVDFLKQGDHSQWRYLTFGFGDQFAYLSRLTTATTIDGSYHTARAIPELRSSGIGSIDSVFWLPRGLKAVEPILQIAGKYGVRWGFVNESRYDPWLAQDGWVERAMLSNGVQLWENPDAVLPAPTSPRAENPLESFSWGTLPLLVLVVTTALVALRLQPAYARRILLQIHTLSVSLLPIGLGLWYFLPLSAVSFDRVYFAYDNALFFLSDGLAFGAVLSWGLARMFAPSEKDRRLPNARTLGSFRFIFSPTTWLCALCVLVSASVLWSEDWWLTLYISLQFWLGFGLFLSLRDRPETCLPVLAGVCLALALQSAAGFYEFDIQSSGFLSPLRLMWPGALTSATQGASVVQLANGARWLRAYGTLSHPNILGTFVVAFLAGPATFFITGQKSRLWALLIFLAGLALLVLTFSRGAWIGLLTAVLLVLLKSRELNRGRLIVLGATGAFCLMAVIIPLRALIFTRIISLESVTTEAFSIKGRAWLAEQALAVIQKHPLRGIGAGAFVIDLAQKAPVGYIIEPVHNLFLLVFSELGVGGALILTGLCLGVVINVRRARRPQAILLSAVLVGLLITSLFDHSLWTQSPGRILFALVFGLWDGQVRHNGA